MLILIRLLLWQLCDIVLDRLESNMAWGY